MPSSRPDSAGTDLRPPRRGFSTRCSICGFHRRGGEYPTLYPVACAPQAWAAGSVYLLLQASLGMEIDGESRRISFSRAALPESIDSLRITNLQVGDAAIDLLIERHPH